MGNGFQFFDILLFGLIAVFILLRLRSTLGSRSDKQDKKESSWSSLIDGGEDAVSESPGDNVISLPDQNRDARSPEDEEAEDWPVEIAGGIAEIRLADPAFDMHQFEEGAAAAYEMVLSAFAMADHETMQQLLAEDVYLDFGAAIRDREERGETLETVLVALREVQPLEVRMNGKLAEVTIKFTAELVNTLRDEEGEVISGLPDISDDVVDIWTFARDVSSRDPNWLVIATRKAN